MPKKSPVPKLVKSIKLDPPERVTLYAFQESGKWGPYWWGISRWWQNTRFHSASVKMWSLTCERCDVNSATDGKDLFGWWEYEIPEYEIRGTLSLLYPSRAQVRCCFPFGLEAEVARGRGLLVAYRIVSAQQYQCKEARNAAA